MLLWNNIDLQKMLKQQIVMHTFSYNFCHLQSAKGFCYKSSETSTFNQYYNFKIYNLRIFKFHESKML
jgi:hypothetical protein